ncbi:MAG: cephalosporin hydroxylase family protein [Methylophilaceae bacterium]
MIKIDMEAGLVIVDGKDGSATHPIGTPEAFAVISKAWIRSGWDTKYVYSFSWMGRPVIQLPEDMLRIQEAIYRIKPDVIIETGIAHGGSLIFYASLFKAMGKGRVIGVDIEIRPHNRQAIEAHELASYITMIEGSSVAPDIVNQVKQLIKPGEKIMVVLDSNHTKAHVLAELEAYAPMVSQDSYIVATDGIMGDLVGAPRSSDDWSWNNPRDAAKEFVANNQEFAIENPRIEFNEGTITEPVTYWPSAWILRK